MEVSEYWDAVARKVYAEGGMKDNWIKRRQIVRWLLDHNFSGKDVLEIGCGLGVIAAVMKLLHGGQFRYTGTEVSEVFRNAASETFGNDIVMAYSHELPFGDAEFDSIWLFDVLEHIALEKRPSTYSEIGRVLRPGGLVVVNNPLNKSGHNPDFDFGFDEEDLGKLCKTAGLTIFSAKTFAAHDKNVLYQFIVMVK